MGSAFTSAATYTENVAYGNDGYSFKKLRADWEGEDFAKATLYGFGTGALIGGAISGVSWGISYKVNEANQKFYNTPDEELSEADQFVKKHKLRRSPVDKEWRSAGMNRESDLAKAVEDGTVDRGNIYSNFASRVGFCGDATCQRFEGGLHLEVPKTGPAVGHYDFFDPAKSPFHAIGHGLEVLIGKTYFNSSVSIVEPGLISPLLNGFIFDWEKTKWFWEW